MKLLWAVLGVSTSLAAAASSSIPNIRRSVPRTLQPRDAATEYYFDQLLDHTDPSKGTFKQRYYFSDQWYKGAGSPIVLSSPGEQALDGFDVDLVGSLTIQSGLMEALGAAGIVLEHRYWGKSSPYPDLTTDHLGYLTVDNAVEDLAYFAQNVALPWTSTQSGNSHPDSTPWVTVGCAYPGMLVAFVQEIHSDVFAAAWSSSAPLQTSGDYWQYWEPVEEGMPKNCSADLAAAISYIDGILTSGSSDQQDSLKTMFGLDALSNDDFAAALTFPLSSWQDLQAFDYAHDGESLFFSFCDAIELSSTTNVTDVSDAPVGLPAAVENWGAAFKEIGPDANCPDSGGSCYSSYDYTSASYTENDVEKNPLRGWEWLVCTQLGFFADGDPGNSSSIVSSLVTPSYLERVCSYMFPNADGSPGSYSLSSTVNDKYHGWNLVATNLFSVNGQYDPWRSASLSSTYAPAFVDTPTQDTEVIPGAHMCWDMYLGNAQYNDDVKATQLKGVQEVWGWLKAWYAAKGVQDVIGDAPTTWSFGGPTVTTTQDDGDGASSTSTGEVATSTSIDDDTTASTTTTDDDDEVDADDKVASAGSEAAEAGDVLAAESTPTSTASSSISDLQSQIDKLESNKSLALASFIANIVLLLLLIGTVVLIVLTKRKAKRTMAGRPKWDDAVWDSEYGTGGAAGGRGQYKALKEQT